jgi:membrane associated rhomboid family serine protease
MGRDRIATSPDREPMSRTSHSATSIWRKWPLLVIFVLVPAVIELVLLAADNRLFASPLLRPFVYEHGAFWAGLLDNWRPNYAAQPYLMFLTYSFLHSGFGHMFGNMVAFVSLLQLTSPRLQWRGFLVVYLSSAIGGAIFFAVLGPVTNPMVGASGALFGLAGAWRLQAWQNSLAARSGGWIILRDCVVMVLLNLVMWVLQGGALAWEAHLGGFLTGVLAMAAIEKRRALRRRKRQARISESGDSG